MIIDKEFLFSNSCELYLLIFAIKKELDNTQNVSKYQVNSFLEPLDRLKSFFPLYVHLCMCADTAEMLEEKKYNCVVKMQTKIGQKHFFYIYIPFEIFEPNIDFSFSPRSFMEVGNFFLLLFTIFLWCCH